MLKHVQKFNWPFILKYGVANASRAEATTAVMTTVFSLPSFLIMYIVDSAAAISNEL